MRNNDHEVTKGKGCAFVDVGIKQNIQKDAKGIIRPDSDVEFSGSPLAFQHIEQLSSFWLEDLQSKDRQGSLDS